jgi:predicted O-methyltransferase YrrM
MIDSRTTTSVSPRDLVVRAARAGQSALRVAVPQAQRRLALTAGPPPAGAGAIWTSLGPELTHDDPPSAALVALAVRAVQEAFAVRLGDVVDRADAAGSPFADWIEVFPGEHYRLLRALTRLLDPGLVIEIGTLAGASALTLAGAGCGAHVVTYDVVPWDEVPATLFHAEDFASGQLEQRIGDLGDDAYWETQEPLFHDADLVFLDGPKDGVFEPILLRRLAEVGRTHAFTLVVDDIRFLEMLDCWRELPFPKMDLSSFGHWSGTGLALVGPPGDTLPSERRR